MPLVDVTKNDENEYSIKIDNYILRQHVKTVKDQENKWLIFIIERFYLRKAQVTKDQNNQL